MRWAPSCISLSQTFWVPVFLQQSCSIADRQGYIFCFILHPNESLGDMVDLHEATSSEGINEQLSTEDPHLHKLPSSDLLNTNQLNKSHLIQDGKTGSSLESDTVSSRNSAQVSKQRKGKEKNYSEADIIDLTVDSPASHTPEFRSFLKRHHRVRNASRSTAPDERIQSQALNGQISSPIIVSMPSPEPSPGQVTINDDLGELNSQLDSSRETGAPSGLDNADSGMGPNAKPSSERDGSIGCACCREGERHKTQSEKLLPIKRRRSTLADGSKCRERFKPPRMRQNQTAGGSTSGVIQNPVDVDVLQSPGAADSEAAIRLMDVQRQIIEDEMLAKVLQEEFNLEANERNTAMDDIELARMLQEEENSRSRQRVESSHRIPSPSAVQMSRRELPTVLSSFRSLSVSPVATSSRMRILRNLHNRQGRRLGGRAINSTESLYHFPDGVDLETRLNFLAAMELASQDDSQLLAHMDRDFNGNDYEMLLTLDDINVSHNHGASRTQIEQLPVSIIQPTDVCEECSICLESPVVGEEIRRLPCMHSFHQQCIDVWLSQQAKCPICKVSL